METDPRAMESLLGPPPVVRAVSGASEDDWVVWSAPQPNPSSQPSVDLPCAPPNMDATVLGLHGQLATVINEKGRSDSRVAKLEARLKRSKELLAAVNVSDEYDDAVVAMIMERHNKLVKVMIDQHHLQKNAEDAVPCSCCGYCGDCIATSLRLLGLSALPLAMTGMCACARGVAA